MKLEDLAAEVTKSEGTSAEPVHRTGASALSIVSGGYAWMYVSDPVSGELQRRCLGPAGFGRRAGVVHGLGAIRD